MRSPRAKAKALLCLVLVALLGPFIGFDAQQGSGIGPGKSPDPNNPALVLQPPRP